MKHIQSYQLVKYEGVLGKILSTNYGRPVVDIRHPNSWLNPSAWGKFYSVKLDNGDMVHNVHESRLTFPPFVNEVLETVAEHTRLKIVAGTHA